MILESGAKRQRRDALESVTRAVPPFFATPPCDGAGSLLQSRALLPSRYGHTEPLDPPGAAAKNQDRPADKMNSGGSCGYLACQIADGNP